MADEMIAEVIQLMSIMSQDEIKEALQTAFNSPGPPVSGRNIGRAITDWKSPRTRLQRILMSPTIPEEHPTIRQSQHYHTFEDGKQAGFEVDYTLKSKIEIRIRPKLDAETLWGEIGYLTKAGQRADTFLKMVDRLDTLTEKIDMLMQTAEKCGIPKTKADLLAKNGNIGSVLKAALTRNAVKTAVRDGAWQSAALTVVFDIKLLFDGHLKQYLINIGVSGLYGGTVSGLSSWVDHPFFGNGLVLGVVVGSAFGAVSLASTGDWERFGKGVGVNILGGAAAWGGAALGSSLGAPLGPIGVTVGAIIGSVSASYAGRWVAVQIPGLGGMTDHEVETAYKTITDQLRESGVEPDPSLSYKHVVEAIMNKGAGSEGLPFNVRMTEGMASDVADLRKMLLDLQEVSPGAFSMFLGMLRDTRSSI